MRLGGPSHAPARVGCFRSSPALSRRYRRSCRPPLVGIALPRPSTARAAAVEAVVIVVECRARLEADDESSVALGFLDAVGGEKAVRDELPQMRAELVVLDDGTVRMHGEPAEPLGADSDLPPEEWTPGYADFASA